MIHRSLNLNLISSSFEDLKRCVSEQIKNTRGIIFEAGYFSEKEAILTDFIFFIETHVSANWSFGILQVSLGGNKCNRQSPTSIVSLNFFEPIVKISKALSACQAVAQENAVGFSAMLVDQTLHSVISCDVFDL